MSLKGLSKPGRRNNREQTSTLNLYVTAMNYKLADDGAVPNKNDILVVGLMHDALGLTAEFDENGNPTTLVDMRLNYYENNESMQKRLNIGKRTQIRDFLVGKDGKDKVKRDGGYVMIAEGCYYDANAKQIVSKYLTRGSSSKDSEDRKVVVNQPMCVLREGSRPRPDGTVSRFQGRIIPFVGENQTFALTGAADFDKKPAEVLRTALTQIFDQLSDPEAGLIGSPGVLLRAVGVEDGEVTGRSWQARLVWDAKTETMLSSADSASHFLASEAIAGEVLGAMEDTVGDPNVFWELIPFQSVRTGQRSLPSNKAEDRKTNNKKEISLDSLSDHPAYYYDDDGQQEVGYAVSSMTARRSFNEIKDSWNTWFATTTMPVVSFAPRVYAGHELITGALPAHLVEAVEANVTARLDARQKRRDDARESREAKEASEPDADVSKAEAAEAGEDATADSESRPGYSNF